MKRKQTDTDNDLQKPTYTNEHLPTAPQTGPKQHPKTQKTIYQASTGFFFRFSLGFLVFDEEWKNGLRGENAPSFFSPFLVYF